MKNTTRKTMLLAALLLLTGGAWAQKTHPGHYLYHGERVEVPVNSEVALAYFRTAQMDTAAIHRNYQCLKEVSLAADKADTLYACEVRLPEGTYEEGVAWLKAQPEVWDVEPVIGTTERVPVSNMFFVKLREQSDAALLAEEAAKCGARHEGPVLPGDLWHIVTVDKRATGDAMSLSTQLGESGKFADVDPGFAMMMRYNTCYNPPSDSHFQNQWGMIDISACDAWGNSTGSGAKVAIIDQGIYTGHEEFSGLNVALSYDATNNTNPAASYNPEHGTQVAGIIFAGQNDYNIAGLAPNADLLNISLQLNSSILYDNGIGVIKRAINKARTSGAGVILCPWDIYNLTAWGLTSSLIENAIDSAVTNGRYGKGSVVVFSSGNYDPLTEYPDVTYPANCNEKIIVVGAMDNSYDRWTNSCYGDELDLIAPGKDILTTTTDQVQYDYFSGTSLAAAHVAGVAALMISMDTNLTLHQIDKILKASARKVGNYIYSYSSAHPFGSWNSEAGYGALDAETAVRLAGAHICELYILDDDVYDDGTEYNNLSPTANNSPFIKLTTQTTPYHNVYTPSLGNTYRLVVTIDNPNATTRQINRAYLKVYWTVETSNPQWRNSWTDVGTICGMRKCGTLFPNSNIITVPAYQSTDVEFSISIPAYESLQCTPLFYPSYISFIAIVENFDATAGLNDIFFPAEIFVRANNNVAWRTYAFFSPVYPGINSATNGDGDCISTLSPNPTTGQATLEYTLPEDVRVGEVLVMNSMGAVVYRAPATGQNHVIDLSNTPSGSYYVYLTGDGELLGMRTLIRD